MKFFVLFVMFLPSITYSPVSSSTEDTIGWLLGNGFRVVAASRNDDQYELVLVRDQTIWICRFELSDESGKPIGRQKWYFLLANEQQ